MNNRSVQWSEDYGVRKRDYRKVTLMNVRECHITKDALLIMWHGTGHVECEQRLADWFLGQVNDALEKGQEKADITMLFNRDLLASGDRIFSQKEIYNHLIKWFEISEETDAELKLALRV